MISGEWGTCTWILDNQGNLSLSGGIATGINEPRDIPWVRYLNEIRSFFLEGPVYFDREAALDMMFFSCTNLKYVDFTGFNTSNVVSMKAMFADCKSLRILDMSCLNLSRVVETSDMFYGTDNLISLIVPRGFKPQGGFISMAKMTSIGGKNTYYIPGSVFNVSYDPNGGIGDAGSLKTELVAGETTRVAGNIFGTQRKAIFKCWNTKRDGSGTNFRPGDNLLPVYSDVTLYAIWAGIPIIGRVDEIEPITYGQRLTLKIPEYNPNEGPEPSWSVQISPDGWNKWTDFNPSLILPAKGDGCYIRFRAKTLIGEAYSDAVRITIRKADYDMSTAEWVAPQENVYDGETKMCHIEGLPEGVTAVYTDDEAVEPGEHLTSVDFEYDSSNYNEPVFDREKSWVIERADFDMSEVHWDYDDDIFYDGTEKIVSVTGLPDGISVIYKGNSAVYSGEYRATAEFVYNAVLYNEPEPIDALNWRIHKKNYDMSVVHWREHEDFVYDGRTKVVSITDIPSGVMANHYGNTAIEAGQYHAKVTFTVSDEDNYETPEPIVLDWTIEKAVFDVSAAVWDYRSAYIFDGDEKSVFLRNIPNGIIPRYTGNVERYVGKYTAVVSWDVIDKDNFIAPPDIQFEWEIDRGYYDMSMVIWDAHSYVYDGNEKGIELINLPEGVRAEYFNNRAVEAGSYEASAVFEYDELNYNCPKVDSHIWIIEKAVIAMDEVFWDYESDDLVYDGRPKTVKLKNLPDFVEVEYVDNTYTDAGYYYSKAVMNLTGENEKNYKLPTVHDCRWSIEKADIDTENIEWSCNSLVYTGETLSVNIVNVPELLDVTYSGNCGVDAGSYIATADFEPKDAINYNKPKPAYYEWHIEKADYDLGNVCWDYYNPKVYNGRFQTVELVNLPDGVSAEYKGNRESQAGTYNASAEFTYDSSNYNMPIIGDCKWEILKAEYPLDSVTWDYVNPFTYDGGVKEVRLINLPVGAEVVYTGAHERKAGFYMTTAEIFLPDEDNYRHPLPKMLSWEILKAEHDMRRVFWAYTDNFVYDGETHRIELNGLPDGVKAVYQENRGINVGKYNAMAEFSVDDPVNYTVPAKMQHEWRIRKAEFNIGATRWTTDTCFEYDGTDKTVRLVGVPADAHVEYSGNSASHCGEYFACAQIIPNDLRNYEMPEIDGISWNIVKTVPDMSRVEWDYNYGIEYDGSAHTVRLANLPEGVIPHYSGNIAVKAGTYYAACSFAVENSRDYNPPADMQLKWEIKKADVDLSNTYWDYTEGTLFYDGASKTVMLRDLPAGVSAEYRGISAVDAGEYIANAFLRVEDTANYNQPVISDLKWKIERGDIDLSGVEWDYDDAFVYNGEVQSVKLRGLPEGVSAVYYDNEEMDAGEYRAHAVICVDTANYNTPSVDSLDWRIDKAVADMGNARWNYTHPFKYDGGFKSIELVDLPAGLRVSYNNNEKRMVGTYYATAEIELENTKNHYAPTVKGCNWTIEKGEYDLSRVRWEFPDDPVYDGEPKSVKLVNLPVGIFPEYTGEKQINAGYYSTSVSFIYDESNYREPIVANAEWSIEKADISMARVRWAYKGAYEYNGEDREVKLECIPDNVNVVYEGNTANLAGEYHAFAHFVPVDETNYKRPRDMELYWSIYKAEIKTGRVYWDYGGAFTYDGKLHKVELKNIPKGLAVEYVNNKATDAGVYRAEAHFTPLDENNYNTPDTIICDWTINKANIDMSGIGFSLGDRELTYNGKVHTVALKNLPKEVSASYTGNTAVDAGEYICDVAFSVKNADNYNTPDPIQFSWNINRAVYNMESVHWYKRGNYVYDGSIKSVRLAGLPHGMEVEYISASGINAGEYTARAILSGDSANYEPVTVPEFNWTIEKAEAKLGRVRWTQPDSMIYDGTVKTVVLSNIPEGMSAVYENNSHIEAGTYEAHCTIIMDDSDNFKAPEVSPWLWSIAKADYDTSHVEWNYNGPFNFDSRKKEVGLMVVGGERGFLSKVFGSQDVIQYVGLPKGSKVEYENNSATACGEYTAIANITPHDTDNYCIPAPVKLTWRIENKEA